MNFAVLPEMRVPRFSKLKAVSLALIAVAVAVTAVACKRTPTAEAQHLPSLPVTIPLTTTPLNVTPVADQLIIEEEVVTIRGAGAAAKSSVKSQRQRPYSYAVQQVVHQSVDSRGRATSIRTKPVTVTM